MSKKSVLERRFVPEGTLIVRQGEPGNCAYLIQSGSVVVYTEHKGKQVQLAKLELGQIFGEMALIFDEQRSASVKATEDCSLIVITRSAFKEKLTHTDSTIKAIVQMLTDRMIASNKAIANKQTDMSDLMKTARIIYQNILTGLPEGEKDKFQSDVLPKLEAFLEGIQGFSTQMKK